MFGRSIRAGLVALRRHSGLAVLLFVVPAVLGYLIAYPIGSAFNASFGASGFGPDLAEGLDPVLLADFFGENVGLLSAVAGLLALMVPILLVWSTVVGVGLVHTLRDGGVRPFWSGVSTFFWRGLAQTALFLVPIGGWTLLSFGAAVVLGMSFSGEVALFWSIGVAVPAVWIAGMAAIDMILDYARIGLVARGMSVIGSAWFGVRFAYGRLNTHLIYAAWFIPSLCLILLPSGLEIWLGASVVLWLVQQLVLLCRSFVTIGWMGSQVALFEAVSEEYFPAITDGPSDTAEHPLGTEVARDFA
ncbi:MAG: hypothetical protein ACI80V_000540 [Rhodothermales bacterium]|jgi:hypothetical protein